MSHRRRGMCTKQHQSCSIVNCSVCAASIRVHTELLKILFTPNHTAWSGPHLVWYMVKIANFPAVVASRFSIPICVGDMERPFNAQPSEELLWLRSEVTNARLRNRTEPRKAGYTVPLIGVCLCRGRLSVFICHVQRNNRSNFLCHYVFIIVILWQITFSQFSESQNAQSCWLIQGLLQLIIGVKILQIAPFQHRSSKIWSRMCVCQYWNMRSFVSINVILCEKTFQLIVTCSCAY